MTPDRFVAIMVIVTLWSVDMTEQEALDLVRRLLKAADDAELTELVQRNLPHVDGVFFRPRSRRRGNSNGKASRA